MPAMNDTEWLRGRLDLLDTKIENLRTDQREQIDRLTRELKETFVAKVEFHPEIRGITDRLDRLEGRGGIIFSRIASGVALLVSVLSILLLMLSHLQFVR